VLQQHRAHVRQQTAPRVDVLSSVARVTVFAGVVEWQTHRLVLVALAFDAFLKPSEPRGSDCSGLGVHGSRLAQDT
jgi:hypothetical protein